ncbi:enolase-phosphatase E1-like [Oppia nitens]|uniref:enolase-phosphatase E1-like n=1 Tax=Oppia nitens TaxID=1686743 RepID=UPI0023DC1541|nr:enolase-phosphatase E1-like [Oppia nitens]
MIELNKPELILVDIEGTTTAITFVKDFLFPYVKTHISDYLDENWNENHLREDIDLLRKQAVEDGKQSTTTSDVVPLIGDNDNTDRETLKQSIVDNVLWQMNADRKTTALKQFQGNIWRFGYQSGAIKGHVYEDAAKAITKWTQELNIKLAIYSSGSVLAQKLLFGYSVFGDLTKFIDNYFDTTIGLKLESTSYTKIAETLDLMPNNIVFITDAVKEAIAAKNAGFNTVLSIREGTEPLSNDIINEFNTITSFADILFK